MEKICLLGIEREFGDVLFFFQDSVTTIMEGIIDLHNDIFFFLIIVVCLVLWMVFYVVNVYRIDSSIINKERLLVNRVVHGAVIEIIWTILPSIVLIMIALPSFSLLYSMDEVVYPDLTVKIIGHQWYWSYDLALVRNLLVNDGSTFEQFSEVEFDSYMLDINDLKLGELRLLEVDNPLYLPTQVHVRFLITSTDVLHAWAVPALGVKLDAVPGRINQTSAFLKREGIFYGQCSEICGVNHGFMPITIKAFQMASNITEAQIDKLDDTSNLLNLYY